MSIGGSRQTITLHDQTLLQFETIHCSQTTLSVTKNYCKTPQGANTLEDARYAPNILVCCW